MPTPLRRTARGFTLVELLITMSALGLVGGIAYAVIVDGFEQFARNISLNKSDNSLRYCLQRLKRDITTAVQPPTLVSYDPTRARPLMAATVAGLGLTSAPGIRLVVNSGPAYSLTPVSANSDVPPTGTTPPIPANTLSYKLWRHVPNGTNGTDPAPLPVIDVTRSASNDYSHNDRLMFLSPAAPAQPAGAPTGAIPWLASTQQIVTEGTAPVVRTFKPGRRLTGLTLPSSTATSFTVTIEDLSTLAAPGAQNLPPITAYNSAYIVHEVAYAVFTNRDAGGNAVSRELRYFPHADDPATFVVLSRDLDPNPQEQQRNDAGNLILAGGNPQSVQPFTVDGADVSTLRVNLPIRALDYARAVAERRLPAGGGPNVQSEFNVSISSKPSMGYRNNVKN